MTTLDDIQSWLSEQASRGIADWVSVKRDWAGRIVVQATTTDYITVSGPFPNMVYIEYRGSVHGVHGGEAKPFLHGLLWGLSRNR